MAGTVYYVLCCLILMCTHITPFYFSVLIAQCNYSYPILVPLICCRLMKLTFEFGFCEDTISGLVFVSHGMYHVITQKSRLHIRFLSGSPLIFFLSKPKVLLLYADDVLLAARICRIAGETHAMVFPPLYVLDQSSCHIFIIKMACCRITHQWEHLRAFSQG